MLYYPLALGFVFHKSIFEDHKSIFEHACKLFGTKWVVQMVHEKLIMAMQHHSNSHGCKFKRGSEIDNDNDIDSNRKDCDRNISYNRNITCKDLVFAAVTNDDISLDGVFAILRYDPTVIASRRCKPQQRNRSTQL